MRFFIVLVALCIPLAATARPTVIELYTSQGCSSCPPAEAYVHQLAQNPNLLTLSFHVHYFDYLGWKDPFASIANTERQKQYTSALGIGSVYTPQIIVDGENAVVGSDERAVTAAIKKAQMHQGEIPVSITPQADGNLRISIGDGAQGGQVSAGLVAWEMHFIRGGYTAVQSGENSGETLVSTNNVIRSVPMTLTIGQQNDFLLPTNFPEDGVAVIVQKQPIGPVVGAAVYIKPPAAVSALQMQ